MLSLETIGYYSKKAGTQWLSVFGSLYPNRGDFILLVANPSSKELLKKARQSFQGTPILAARRQRFRASFPAQRVRIIGHFGRRGIRP
jgi:hypothetical protein